MYIFTFIYTYILYIAYVRILDEDAVSEECLRFMCSGYPMTVEII